MKHKMLRRLQISMVGLIAVFIASATTAFASQLAPPPLPSSFYGSVNGDYNEETAVSAVIQNTTIAQTTLKNHEGQWVYSLIVPGDNPDTNAVEGGNPGDIIEFRIDGQPAAQTAVWQSGRNAELNLTAGPALAANTTALWLLGGFILVALGVLGLFALRRQNKSATNLLPLQENRS